MNKNKFLVGSRGEVVYVGGIHQFDPINMNVDPNCKECGGKHRDSIHRIKDESSYPIYAE